LQAGGCPDIFFKVRTYPLTTLYIEGVNI